MAGGRDALGRTMVKGFGRLAKDYLEGARNGDWRFLLSPGLANTGDKESLPRGVTLMGRLEEPWDLLCSVRAVAILTPLGFGMKTTVVDGLAAGCHVIVHPTLAVRLPEEIRERCIVWSPEGKGAAERLEEELQTPPQETGVNEMLRLNALEALSQAVSRRAAA
jgi:hypothetical protein